MTNKNKILITVGVLLLLGAITKRKAIIKLVKTPLNNQLKNEFVAKVSPIVIKHGAAIGVPYKFMIAQIALETRYGQSSLFAKYNNVGGVKAVGTQSFVLLPTQEDANPGVNDGKTKTVYQKFATYPTLEEGIKAYSKILQNRYFAKYQHKTTDPIVYAKLLQSGKPKYATDDKYPDKIATVLKDLSAIA